VLVSIGPRKKKSLLTKQGKQIKLSKEKMKPELSYRRNVRLCEAKLNTSLLARRPRVQQQRLRDFHISALSRITLSTSYLDLLTNTRAS
jgi:hypothetical protein